jgi:hypothetical protein
MAYRNLTPVRALNGKLTELCELSATWDQPAGLVATQGLMLPVSKPPLTTRLVAGTAVARQLQALEMRLGPNVATGVGAAVELGCFVSSSSLAKNLDGA